MDKDPITLEIIQNSLRSISDEMFDEKDRDERDNLRSSGYGHCDYNRRW
jgi:hypothetical protein